jgi:hypothetical protein
MAGNLAPGSASRLGSAVRAARPGWGTSACAAMSICAPFQGARSTLQSALRSQPSQANRLQRWILDLYGRKGTHKTLVAIANKHARVLWAMLAKDEGYDPAVWQRHPINPALSPVAHP